MNGVHDMGGMEGLGAIAYEPDEPVFHAQWEARVMGLTVALAAWKKWNLDASRHAREKIPGPTYLGLSYYEIWLVAVVEQMIETGLLTREELETGRPAPGGSKAEPPLGPERVAETLARGAPVTREVDAPPRFAVGEAVRTRNIHPSGHTRLPRYARGKPGRIHRLHGAHVFPDSNAHFLGENPAHLYSVRMEAEDLWGPAMPLSTGTGREAVYLDLWEHYLEPT